MVNSHTSFPFLTAEWRHLVMANFVVDPSLLQTYVPAGTEIDHWKGRTYIRLMDIRYRGGTNGKDSRPMLCVGYSFESN